MTTIDAAAKIAQRDASQPQSQSKSTGGEFVFVGLPDVNGSIRGKAFRPDAFNALLRDGTMMTDLLLALDPADTPITDYTRFGIRSGAGDLLVRPDASTLHELTWRPGWRICLATPSWRDGSPCELASREVLRRVVAALAELRYEALAALEYEVRLFDSDAKPLSSGLSYSFSELRRFEVFVAALVELAAAGVAGGDRRRARPSACGIATAQSHHQLLQAAGPRVVCSCQCQLGRGESICGGSRHRASGAPRALSLGVSPAGRRRESLPCAGRRGGIGCGRHSSSGQPAPGRGGRRLHAHRLSRAARVARECAAGLCRRPGAPPKSGRALQ